MHIGWGWRIAVLYTAFAVSMIFLVIVCSHQKFDLVSKDYYKDEIAYQNVLNAGKNQAQLSGAFTIHANESSVIVEFPTDFKSKVMQGNIYFYSPIDESWDKTFPINADNNTMSIPRSALKNSRYTIKINCTVDGKQYYQQSDISLMH